MVSLNSSSLLDVRNSRKGRWLIDCLKTVSCVWAWDMIGLTEWRLLKRGLLFVTCLVCSSLLMDATPRGASVYHVPFS